MSDPNYYAIIPATVRYDKNLSNSQKIMFGEITALSQKNGYCHASNNYFAKLYDVDPSTVSKWVKNLKENDYIHIEYDRDGKQIKSRKIKPLMDGRGIEINQQGIEKKGGGVLNKDQGGIEKTAKYNTTRANTTSKSNKESLPARIENCDSIKDLSDIWFSYRKEKNKWPSLSEQEMLRHEMNKWGLDKSKKIITVAMKNGWVSLKEEYINNESNHKSNGKENRAERFFRIGEELFEGDRAPNA